MYKTEDYGLLIGLTTMPFGREKDFIEYEINSIFETHRENVKQACSDREEPGEAAQFERSLYKPKIYGIFGSFDLAVFALVDDFSLATRYFHPFSPFIEKKIKEKKPDYKPYNFAFHVISGVCPDLSGIDAGEQRLTDRFAPILEAEAIKKYPLMGMTSLKVNNSLLVGTGGKLIDLILKKIQAILAKHQKKQGNFTYLINHSFSWHELTITFFSNNYKIIKDIVFELRSLTFFDLSGVASQFNITPLFERIKDDCLLSEQLKNERPQDRGQYIENAHLFVHTNTIFGYDLDLLLQYPDAPIPEKEEDFGLYIKWDIKPGHFSAFIKDLNEAVNEAEIPINWGKAKITAGKGDYALQLEQNSISLFLQLMDAIKTHKLMGHVRKMATVPEFSTAIQEPERYVALEKHYLFHDELGAYSFDAKVISEARAELKALMVPKIIRERVTNMFVMYNDGIHDPVLFGYFIELRAFLNEVLDHIKSFRSQQITMVATIVRHMEEMIRIFEHGYKNRFGQSYLMNEITDYNIEFKGGIQQLISAYDGAYKSQTALLGERIGRSVAYVAGDPNTLSDILSVGLNYFHLYQPELFATAATHEASSFLIKRLEGSGKDGEELKDMIDLYKKLVKKHREKKEDPINEAIQYFLTDIATLYIGFNRNFEQFFYWHWVYFLQSLSSYQVNGKIHEVIMEGFMARMLLIDYYFHDGEHCFFDGKILPPFTNNPPSSLIEAWEYAIINLNGRIKSLFVVDDPANRDHLAYFMCTQDYVLALILDEFIENAKYDEGLIEGTRESIRKTSPKIYKKIDKLYMNNEPKKNEQRTKAETRNIQIIRLARKVYIDEIAKEIKAHFKSGKAFSFHELQKRADLQHVRSSFFYQALFNAYLQLIQDICINECKIKDRSNTSGDPMRHQNFSTDINLEIDPLGGMFSSSLACRRIYYQYRILFLKSLWNLSTINKKALFLREE